MGLPKSGYKYFNAGSFIADSPCNKETSLLGILGFGKFKTTLNPKLGTLNHSSMRALRLCVRPPVRRLLPPHVLLHETVCMAEQQSRKLSLEATSKGIRPG